MSRALKTLLCTLTILTYYNHAQCSYQFQSYIFTGLDGEPTKFSVPWAQMAGQEEPFFLDANKYRSEDCIMMVEIKGSILANGMSENQKVYSPLNQPYLHAFSKVPLYQLPEGIGKGSRFNSDTNFTIKQDNVSTPMSHWTVRGTIRFRTDRLVVDTFFMPRSRLVVESTNAESPIEKVIFYLANNQLPMRLKGYIYFEKEPVAHLETMNVSIIKIVHKYKDYAPTVLAKKGKEGF